MINLTDKAVGEVKRIISELNNDQKYLRVAVVGGGCSGFKFTLNLDDVFKEEKDSLYEQDGIQIVVDKRSELYVIGATVDYHEDLLRKGFIFNSPVETKGICGCGSSVKF